MLIEKITPELIRYASDIFGGVYVDADCTLSELLEDVHRKDRFGICGVIVRKEAEVERIDEVARALLVRISTTRGKRASVGAVALHTLLSMAEETAPAESASAISRSAQASGLKSSSR